MATIELTEADAREVHHADELLTAKNALELAAIAYAHAPTHLFTRAHDQLLLCAEVFGKARDAFHESMSNAVTTPAS